MYVACRLSRSPLFKSAKSTAAVSSAPRLQPLAFFDAATFRPRTMVALSQRNTLETLRRELPSDVRLMRGRAGNASGTRRSTDLIAVTTDYKVVAVVRLPLCMLGPVKLPLEGLTLDAYAEHVQAMRDKVVHTLVCACREDAIGFAIVDVEGNDAFPGTVTKTFIARTGGLVGDAKESRERPRFADAPLVSATQSSSSRFYHDVNEHVNLHHQRIDACGAFVVRQQGGMFNRIARNRHAYESTVREVEAGPDQDADAGANKTVFDDPRWYDIAPALMPMRDVVAHRSPDVNMTAVIGCTRHGSVLLA
jgi:hypothetical protein